MTTDLKTAQEMMAAAVAARAAEDPEIVSVKRVLKLLDKTAKSNRTYGPTNPVAQKFTQQLFEELTHHLAAHSKLAFLVQRSELLCKDSVVYQAEKDGGSESLAFKLYADGIRELVLHQGLTKKICRSSSLPYGATSTRMRTTMISSHACGLGTCQPSRS